jgi:hypothetical protein
LSSIANRGNQRRRANRPDPGDRHEPTGCVMLCCEYFNLPGNSCKSDIDDLEFIPKLFEKKAGCVFRKNGTVASLIRGHWFR